MSIHTPNFRIRDAVSSSSNADAIFITAAFDSCIPHLAMIGSATQWGSEPISKREGFLSKRIQAIVDAETCRLTGKGDQIRVLIAEADLGNGEYVPVGSSTLRGGYVPSYFKDQKHLAGIMAVARNYLYLETLVTDFREETRTYRKGAGAALVRHASEYARELGNEVMFVDCWAGNEGRLVKFYEGQGFTKVAGFVVETPGGDNWPGMFLRMDLEKQE